MCNISFDNAQVHHLLPFQNKQEIIDALIQSQSEQLAKEIRTVIESGAGTPNTMENVFRMITDLTVRASKNTTRL